MTITKADSNRATGALYKASFTCATALSAAAGIGALDGSSRAFAEHVPYEIDMVGYNNTDHTRSNGARSRSGVSMNDAGHVVGNQRRYQGGGNLETGQTAWTFQRDAMIRVGLFEGGYVRTSDEAQSSTAKFLNASGQIAGESNKYFADDYAAAPNGDAGKAAWVYRSGTSERVGLYDDDIHDRNDGFQSSTVVGLSDSGHVVGNSIRYSGGNANGGTAWITGSNSADTTSIAPTGAEYVRFDDQFQESTVQYVNSLPGAVSAAGTARRFHGQANDTNPGGNAGQAAWVHSGGTTTKVGLTANEHTSTAGEQSSSIQALNKAGDVIGTSLRYGGDSGNSARGQSAFLRLAGGGSNRIGLTNAEHTRDNGERFSQATKLNDAGFAVGHSNRYNETNAQKGQSAWIAQGTSTERIGLIDPEHTFVPDADEPTNTIQFSQVQHLNELGHAAGFSTRYEAAAGASRGQSAWRYNNGTARIGFFDDVHTRTETSKPDYQFSDVRALNNAGQLIGRSQRFEDETQKGFSAYHFSEENGTARIGLFNGVHIAEDGTQDTTALFLNDAGQAAGISSRFDPDATTGAFRGSSGWFYDDEAQVTHSLVFSTRDDGQALTSLSFLTEDSVVIGSYTLYDGPDAVGERAFFWDFNVADDVDTALDERFHDLGDVVEGGLTASQWASLNSATDMSDFGHILGTGTRTDAGGRGTMHYLLTPIPEPSSIALLALGGLALMPRRRR